MSLNTAKAMFCFVYCWYNMYIGLCNMILFTVNLLFFEGCFIVFMLFSLNIPAIRPRVYLFIRPTPFKSHYRHLLDEVHLRRY